MTAPDLRERVFAAVDAGYAAGNLLKSDVVRAHTDMGVSRASLYRWVDLRIQELATGIAMPFVDRTARIREATDRLAARGAKAALAPVPAAPGRSDGIDYLPGLQDALKRLTVLLAMAEDDNGKIRNIKLTLHAVDLVGKTLQRAANIQDKIADQETQLDYVRALGSVIRRQEPAVRDKIIREMVEVNSRFGAM